MEREDILSKSRNENKKGDELTKRNEEKSEFFRYYSIGMMIAFVYFLCMTEIVKGNIYVFQKPMSINEFCGMLIIFSCVVSTAVKYHDSRKRSTLLFLLFWISGFLMGIYRIFIE